MPGNVTLGDKKNVRINGTWERHWHFAILNPSDSPSAAAVFDKTPLTVVQAAQPSSFYRVRPLDTQSQLDGWLTCAFPSMLHSPSGFSFG